MNDDTPPEHRVIRGIMYGLLLAGIFWTVLLLCIITPVWTAQ